MSSASPVPRRGHAAGDVRDRLVDPDRRVGSGLLARLMARFTWIIWLGGGLLGYVAGEMVLADEVVGRWMAGAPLLDSVLPPLLGCAIMSVGWWSGRNRRAALANVRL